MFDRVFQYASAADIISHVVTFLTIFFQDLMQYRFFYRRNGKRKVNLVKRFIHKTIKGHGGEWKKLMFEKKEAA